MNRFWESLVDQDHCFNQGSVLCMHVQSQAFAEDIAVGRHP